MRLLLQAGACILIDTLYIKCCVYISSVCLCRCLPSIVSVILSGRQLCPVTCCSWRGTVQSRAVHGVALVIGCVRVQYLENNIRLIYDACGVVRLGA